MTMLRGSMLSIAALAFACAGCSALRQPDQSVSPGAGTLATPAGVVSNETTPTPPTNVLAGVTFKDIKGNRAELAIKQEAALGILATATGHFKPNAPIARALYAQWLVNANNTYFEGQATKLITLGQPGGTQTYADVKKSSPYFPYVQGLANAGFLISLDPKHFAPDRSITREEMIAMLDSRELGGATPPPDAMTAMPKGFVDAATISKPYWGVVNADASMPDSAPGLGNIPRIFGNAKALHPQQPATRAEAALSIQLISGGKPADVLP